MAETDAGPGRVFRYHLAWYMWPILLAMLAWAAWSTPLFLQGQTQASGGRSASDVAVAAILLAVCVAFPLALPVSLALLAWRGFVAVGSEGVSWRKVRGGHFRRWDRIVAVSRPAVAVESERRRGVMTIRLVTDRGYSNIYAYCLEDSEEVARTIAQWGGLSGETELMGRQYHCRPGWRPGQGAGKRSGRH